MRFCKYLEAERVPEWEKKYIDYKALKRQIKSIAAAQERQRNPSSGECVSLLKRASTYLGYDSFSTAVANPLSEDGSSARHSTGQAGSSRSDAYDIIVSSENPSRENLNNGRCTHECHDSKCNHFDRIISATPQIALGISAANRNNNSNTPIDLAYRANVKIPISAQDTFTEGVRQRREQFLIPPISKETFETMLKTRVEEERVFFDMMDNELQKVNGFFREKQDLFDSRLDKIKDQQMIYDEMLSEESEASTLRESFDGGLKNQLRSRFSTNTDAKSPIEPSPKLRAARQKLKKAILELYRGMEMLKNYRILCYTGFVKALKKYQKTAKWCEGTEYFLSQVDSCYMSTSTKLNSLSSEIESMYVQRYAGGSRSKGMSTLRVTSGNINVKHGSTFRSGILLGISVPLIAHAIYEANLISNEERVPYHHELLQVYGGIFLVLIFLLLFSLNIKAWSHAHINHRFIFEVDPRDNLDSWQFLELSSWFVFIASIVFWSNFGLHIDHKSYICVYVLIGLLLGMFVLPLNIFYWSSRRWLLRSLGRIALSGIFSVKFRDFFLGDELCSLTYTFSMMLLFGCATANSWTDVSLKCNISNWWSNSAFLMIPNLFRLLQCIRRYYDTKDAFPHLANGAKYSSTIITIWLASAHRISGGTAWNTLWVASAIINSCFTSLWDLLMDWGLFDGNTKHRFLRAELKFERAWIYYVASVVDVILRFAWITQITPSFFSFGHAIHQSTVAYIAAVLEVLRRVSWNFFRVENEHINNCGQFRATIDIPLPFNHRRRDNSTASDSEIIQNEFEHDYSIVRVPPPNPLEISATATTSRPSSSGVL